MVDNDNYDEFCNRLANLYVERRFDLDGDIREDYINLRGSEEPVFPQFNNRSQRGQRDQILDYRTAYGANRDIRANRMKRGSVPRTVRPNENPENPRDWFRFYVHKQSFNNVMQNRNGIVMVRSQKHNVRGIRIQRRNPAGQLNQQPYPFQLLDQFKGIRLQYQDFNGVFNYYVQVENYECVNCSCPDRLVRDVECKHMKLVSSKMNERLQDIRLQRRLRRRGIDARNILRSSRRGPRTRNQVARNRISRRNRLFENVETYDDFA